MDGLTHSSSVERLPLLNPGTPARQAVREWLASQAWRATSPLVAICPASQMSSKAWAEERFIEIGRRIASASSATLVVVGGRADRATSNSLASSWRGALNAAGEFSVIETAALLEMCSFAITLDTGPMHLAAAVGTKCIALFSAIEYAGKWAPLGQGHVIIRKEVPCAGCRRSACPIPGHPCMREITVDEVWRHVEEALVQSVNGQLERADAGIDVSSA